MNSQNTEPRRVFLTGLVDCQVASAVIAHLLFLAQQSEEDPIELLVNSPGGAVSSGLGIVDAMRSIKCPITTICIGEALSISAVIVAAGTKSRRRIFPHAMMMIHTPSNAIDGPSSKHLMGASFLKTSETSICNILSASTDHSPEEILKDIESEKFFDATEAVNYGLVDYVVREYKFNVPT